ncbi:hypothetical protein [Amycolatopsis sp. H20-H5]|uniref:hypothetical protein n=1 Tax=Amycolatopsis sp. H20-H5 TaxID=3046309 RepID=UPI002DB585CD|nr:hypothetical protein [Amycolatopsis sp. H20-H5]MEC3974582.1 hypothetical protein [Amycolatopsis sp. H20-H5]
MTRYWIELGFQVKAESGDLEEHFLSLMDALLDEPGAVDPDIAAELATGKVHVSTAVDADTDTAALERALLITRSAVHKAGGFTPDWPKPDVGDFVVIDGFDARVRPTGLASC